MQKLMSRKLRLSARRRLCAFFRGEQREQNICFHARAEFHLRVIDDVSHQPVHLGAAHILVRHFAATMKDHGFHFVAFAEKTDNLVLPNLIIVLGCGRPKFHFLDVRTFLVLLSFVSFFVCFVEKLAVVHNLADRRHRIRRNFHHVEPGLTGGFHRVGQSHHAQLVSLFVHHANFASAYSLVYFETTASTTLCDKLTSRTCENVFAVRFPSLPMAEMRVGRRGPKSIARLSRSPATHKIETIKGLSAYTPLQPKALARGRNMNSHKGLCVGLLVLISSLTIFTAHAKQAPGPGAQPATAMPSVLTVPPGAQPSANFNADVATDAYLAQIPADATAKSDAYFEGGYWLILWDFLYGAAVCLLLLNLRWSAGMRNLAERITRFKPLQTLIYWTEYLVITFILGFPLAVYEGYFREHKYGLATQTFGPWMGDQFKDLLVGLVLGGLLVMLLFGVVRRLPRTWHIWAALVAFIFAMFTAMIAPVFIFPIFNKITPLNDPKITQPILSMAHANGIPANDVYEIDASRQSTRMSANVSGLGSTMRITLNDNLLRRASPEEIQAVMGHEMGHYVLHHIYKDMLFILVVIVVGFSLLRWSLDWSLKRWGEKWQIRGVGDIAVLPLVLLILSIFGFVFTPIQNTQTRTNEHEADMYGINASRQPDGFAQAAIHLGEYRKMSPGPVEEWIFFDHPSGRHRIHDAMQWKAENLKLFTPQSNP